MDSIIAYACDLKQLVFDSGAVEIPKYAKLVTKLTWLIAKHSG